MGVVFRARIDVDKSSYHQLSHNKTPMRRGVNIAQNVSNIMNLSPVSLGISIGVGVVGLRGLWKLQHRLSPRGYFIQFGLVLLGVIFLAIGFPPKPGLVAVIFFDVGVILMAVFILFPDVVYYSLRWYGRRMARRDSNQTESDRTFRSG